MRLSLANLALLLGYAVLMSLGQIAFKFLARSLGESPTLAATALRLPFNVVFWAVGLIYFASMLYWVWILTRVPLSIAYPFAALALLIVPVLSWFFFGESLNWRYWTGIALIMAGISLVAR